MSERPQILTPWNAAEAISLREAARVAGVSAETVRRWCPDYHLGRMVGGVWRVSRVALTMMLEDNEPALQAYLGGDRSGPLVAPYFQRHGL